MDQWLTDLGLQALAPYAPLLIGVLFAVAVLVVGRLALGRRPPPAPVESEPEPEPAYYIGGKDPFIHGSAREKRQSLRRKGNPVEILISDADGKVPPYHGLVVDRSMGGLCLSVDEAIPVGTVLSVRAAKSAGVMPWVRVEVKSCRSGSPGWELGCQFVQMPPSSVLWSFG